MSERIPNYGALYPDVRRAFSSVSTRLDVHLTDTADAHDASAISVADAGSLFTATEVESALAELAAQPVSWTPTLTQGSAVTKTVERAWYIKRPDGTFNAVCVLTATAAGTGGNVISVSLPFTLLSLYDVGGSFLVSDASPGVNYVGSLIGASTTTVNFYVDGGTTAAALGTSPAYTIASGDSFYVHLHGRWK